MLVHGKLGHLARRAAAPAGRDGRGHLGAEHLDQQPADRIAVNNTAVLSLYARLQFTFRDPQSTFHLWASR